jgi:CheY-like chemotaxis protein
MNPKPILYVEDETNDIVFMQIAFARAEVRNRLVTVSDGQAVVDYLAGQGKYADRNQYPMPGLVLLDLNLPKKPGLEVLKWIRHQPACHTLPVVVFTSSSREIDIHRSYALGANACVVKPALLAELQEAVKAIKDFWLNLNQPPPDPQLPPVREWLLANSHDRAGLES